MPLPRLVCVRDFEEYAERHLDRNTLNYYQTGANDQATLRDNVNAFRRFRLRPRVLRDVSNIDLSTSVQGQKIDFPIMVAPTGVQRLAHPAGETATATAAQELATCYTLSCSATSSFQEVSAASPSGLKWFQLYVLRDRRVTLELVRRAERHGFSALVLTVDCQVWGRNHADMRRHFQLPPHLRLHLCDETGKKGDATLRGESMASYMEKLYDTSLTWEDVRWLKRNTTLPVILKGILTAEDAKMAVAVGAAGVVVSNHGGRTLDSLPASVDALPEVVAAVAGRCEVYMDGGIRSGIDVMKCLALGARAVLIGRPVLWGLAYNGKEGVRQVFEILKEELRIAMALSGARTVGEISRDMVVHESYYTNLLQKHVSKL